MCVVVGGEVCVAKAVGIDAAVMVVAPAGVERGVYTVGASFFGHNVIGLKVRRVGRGVCPACCRPA